MAKKTIRQRIALDGGQQIKRELEEFGETGERVFRELQTAANRLDGVGGGFVKSLQNAQKSMAALSKSFIDVGRQLRNVGQTVSTYVTLPIVGLGATALKVAGDFESAMNEFVANTGAAGDAFDSAKDKAIELGNASIFSATESAQAMTELAKVGLSFEQIMEGAADATVKLAAANGAQLAPAAAVVGDIMNQFKLTAQEVPGIINGVSGALIQSKLDFDGYRLAIGQAGGTAGALGVTLEDFNAVLSATASSFASGSDAGTSFKTFLQRLTPNTKKAAALFKELNLQFFDSQGNMRSMAEIAQELQDKFGEMSEEALNVNLGELFGTDAIRTAIALMQQGEQGINRFRQALANTNAEDLAAVRVRGLNGALDQLKSAFDDAAIAVGDTGLLKGFTDLTLKAGELLRTLADASPKTLSFGIAIAGIAAAIGPVLTSIGLMTIGIGGLVGAGAKLIGIIRGVIAAFALLRAATLSFPGLVVFQLIGAAIGLWAASADQASAALERHRGTVDKLKEAYAAAGHEVAKMTQEVKDRLFVETLDSLTDQKTALNEAIEALRQELFIARDQENFGPLIQQFIDGTLEAEKLAEAVAKIGADNPDLAPAAGELLKAISESGVEDLSRAVQEAEGFLDLLTGKITDAEFQASKFGEAFKAPEVVGGLKDIGTAADETKTKVEELAGAITVTRHGGAEPVTESFNVVNGIAQAVEQAKQKLGELDTEAKAAGEAVKEVAAGIQLAVRSAPEALDAPSVKATADAVVADLQRIAPAASQAAGEANAALSTIGTVDASSAQAAAEAIIAPFRTIAEQVRAIFAGIAAVVQSGFANISATVDRLAADIQATISRIIAALQAAVAAAARLRAQAAAASSSTGGGGLNKFAGGGFVSGPGTSTSDSIPAWLSAGEFVINARATRMFLPLLRAINGFRLPQGFLDGIRGFSMGGLADAMSSVGAPTIRMATGGLVPVAASSSAQRPVNITLDGQDFALVAADDVAEKLARAARGAAVRSAGRRPGWYR